MTKFSSNINIVLSKAMMQVLLMRAKRSCEQKIVGPVVGAVILPAAELTRVGQF